MRIPTIVVYEKDGRLAEQLRQEPACAEWSLRELRGWESCRKVLSRGGPRVAVVRVGADLAREFVLLERLANIFPDVPCIVVGDREHASLAGLANDLGASLSLFPPLPRSLLGPAVASMLTTALPPEQTISEPPIEGEANDG